MSPNAQTLRRFLQAPEKVRFPVVAPLVLGAICLLALVAALVFDVFIPFADSVVRSDRALSMAFKADLRARQLEVGMQGELAWHAARDIDRVVLQRAQDDDEITRGTLRGWALSKTWLRGLFATDASIVRTLAENRLKRLSGKAPAWAATARLCEEGSSRLTGGHRFQWNYTWGIAEIAQAYTQVLGREIKPADLLPLVPNGRCE